MNYSRNIEPLTKENFYKWRAQVQTLLMRNNTWEYVTGKKIRTTENAAEWDITDRKTRSNIILTITPEALMQVKDCNTSKEVWDKLIEIYCLTYPAYKTMLIKRLINCKMQEDGDMNNHIRNFSDLLDKLKEIYVYIHDDIRTTLLLHSIPNSYEDFKIAIETGDKLPSFEALKIRLLREESERRQKEEYENNTYHNDSRIGNATEVSTHSGIATKRPIHAVIPSIPHKTLYEEIINILKDANIRTMNLKRIRLMIEAKYNIYLNHREEEIHFLVMQYLRANTPEQERERQRQLNNPVIIYDTEDETESESDENGEEE